MSHFDDNEEYITGLSYNFDRGWQRKIQQSLPTVSDWANKRMEERMEEMLKKGSLEDLEDQAARLKKRIKMERRRRELFGLEPDIGSVIAFEKTYGLNEAPYRSMRNGEQPVVYMYAAIRTKIGWVVTGREGRSPMDWTGLIDFIGESPCRVAGVWDTIR